MIYFIKRLIIKTFKTNRFIIFIICIFLLLGSCQKENDITINWSIGTDLFSYASYSNNYVVHKNDTIFASSISLVGETTTSVIFKALKGDSLYVNWYADSTSWIDSSGGWWQYGYGSPLVTYQRGNKRPVILVSEGFPGNGAYLTVN